jgi:lipopolysaccharide export system permease protein
MFVLLMLFLWKYIDDLIGKGLEWYVILELMMYASATNVAMALPLSVLLSSIMTYGSLGENYELVAIKSAGISLQRALYPMFILVGLISIMAFLFSDYMLPKASLKYYSLLWDAREQKSANFLPEGIFSNSFPGYTIRVRHKDEDGQTLHDLIIYQRSLETNTNSVTFAKQGKMYLTPNNKYLVLKLENGVRYEEAPAGGAAVPNPRQTFTRYRFASTQQRLDMSSFQMKRTDENMFSRAYQMMNLKQLKGQMDTTQNLIDSGAKENYRLITPFVRYFNMPHKSDSVKKPVAAKATVMDGVPRDLQSGILANALSEVRYITDALKGRHTVYKDYTTNLHAAEVEYQKKFTLSAACLALFLIGAPLGAIIRKGGLGLPVVISVVFFLIYHIISTIGEKYVKAGDAGPIVMWAAILILAPMGLFLSYKAANDSVIFDADSYKHFFVRLFKRKKEILSKDQELKD